MLVYFKNTQGITQGIDVKPEETMKNFVARVGQLGSMEKVRINMIQHSRTCNNGLTDILLEDISKDINMHIYFQHELMDSDNTKSTSEINAMYEELWHKQFKENVMQSIKNELDLFFQQSITSNIELHFYEPIAQLESLVENTKKIQTEQLLEELEAKNDILTKVLDYLFNIIRTRNPFYITRNHTNIPLFKINHIFFKNSFFPSTIVEWNNLDPKLRNSNTYETFKNTIPKFLRPSPNSVFKCHKTPSWSQSSSGI